MKTLIVEDDFVSRMLMQQYLSKYGKSHAAINGAEAIKAVDISLQEGEPYDLICLDIMMPEVDGQEALREIRRLEEEKGIRSSHGAKIVMTTALNDLTNVKEAFYSLCDGYLVKLIQLDKLTNELKRLNLLDEKP